ncbi:hypothetical protein ACFWP7_40960, partial [Streptomyces sp. NPDC058470]|uniref:hypothetical protein n=1 Tax=Streptomyces sp. NPDC058470 TaxID=3346515 RepID=UPI003666312D
FWVFLFFFIRLVFAPVGRLFFFLLGSAGAAWLRRRPLLAAQPLISRRELPFAEKTFSTSPLDGRRTRPPG